MINLNKMFADTFSTNYSLNKVPLIFNSLLRNFLTDPTVGSVMPTSHNTIEIICKQIKFSYVNKVAEFGPGDGAITKRLLEYMLNNANLYAFEKNKFLYDELSNSISDSRFKLFNLDAQYVQHQLKNQKKSFDLIISGIPLSLHSTQSIGDILSTVHELLANVGMFILYQSYFPLTLPTNRVKQILNSLFVIKHQQIAMLNLPPLIVMVYKKKL